MSKIFNPAVNTAVVWTVRKCDL